VFFRNQVGATHTPDGRLIRFGLCVGSSDLIGWVPLEITQDMVGQKVAVFAAVEVKKPGGKATEDQINFIRNVTRAGGYAGIARSPEEAIAIIQGF
jgi:hypothetical protein